MTQKVVLKVTMDGQRCCFRIMKGDHARKKAMRIAVGLSGVESAAIKGQDKDQIEVKGKGIDTVKLATLLTKKVGKASIVSVAEEKKEEKKDELKIQYMVEPPSYGLYPYACYEIPRYDTPSCSIM
ncbi:disease resistance protein RGA5-like [Quercus robur]|uniref:disease resistance protein RGA5-like n=1 Tax=Quercus robur TaxID=38942 RepID=UPI00216283DE|nr:disease resistance protein RGA5-like [Quercus robur]